MPSFTSSVPHAALLLAFQLSPGNKTETTLEAVTGLPAITVRAALRDLERKGLMLRPLPPSDASGGPSWDTACALDSETLEELAETLCTSCPEDSVLHQMGVLGGAATLEDCENVVRFLDDRLKDNDPAVFACFEMTVRFLLRWGVTHRDDAGQKSWRYAELVLVVQSMCMFSHRFLPFAAELSPVAHEVAARNGSERFMPMIRIFRNYIQIFLDDDHPLPPALFQRADKVRDFDEDDLQDRVPVFKGIQFFLEGRFRETLECYARRPEHNHWWYKRFFEPLSFCASQAAMYLREYPLATGIIESARRTAELAGEKSVARLWLCHLSFSLLRKGDLDEAIRQLDFLLSCVTPESNYKIFSSAVRGLALYHHLSGRTDAAYRVLHNETCQAIRRGVPHSPFLDPLVLDLLYVFEQRGYPPVPRYELETTIAGMLRQTNAQLCGAAMRVQALRLRGRGTPPDEIAALLLESISRLEPTGDIRELVLSRHELANTLETLGKHREARLQRTLLADLLGNSLDGNTSYRTAAILATSCASFPALGVAREPETSGRALLDRCHAAFNRPPIPYRSDELFQRMLDIVQIELQSERAALFRPSSEGWPECVAAVNLTRMELDSQTMHTERDWIASCLHGLPNSAGTTDGHPAVSRAEKAPGHDGGMTALRRGSRLCLRLEVGDTLPWLLYMDSAFTSGTFQHVSVDTLHDAARLFAAEVRSGIRLDRARNEEARRQQDRLIAITRQQDGEAPIIGEGLRAAMEQAFRVGVTDAPVLVLGETGVGKEIMARHIHQISRRSGPFVVVHPASLPESLFESEFFGYERGAFTGAVRQKIGLFELADQGTLFIDEIGEMPSLIQTKLLRVLQDQRFMRLGGTQEIRSRFRLVAATNRDLWKEVRTGSFREDLLYRISVVPLTLPPLRERKEDIPDLVRHFMTQFSRRYDKHPLPLSSEQWQRLCTYDWPGNVRELKNVVERAVILNMTDSLDFVLGETPVPVSGVSEELFSSAIAGTPTLAEMEERYLRHVMQLSGGRVRGPDGAETLLKMKRSTLYAKLKKHGIPCGPC